MSTRPYTTFEICKRLVDACMEHKHAVAIAESIGEFVEEREQAIRAELSLKDDRRTHLASAKGSSTPTRPPGLLLTAAGMLVKDRHFAFMMTVGAISWAWIFWNALCR